MDIPLFLFYKVTTHAWVREEAVSQSFWKKYIYLHSVHSTVFSRNTCQRSSTVLRTEYKVWHEMSMWAKECVLVAQSCLTLCDPTNCSSPGCCVHGFSRQEYRGGLPFPSPGDLPDPWSHLGLPHCRLILHHLSQKRSPWGKERVGRIERVTWKHNHYMKKWEFTVWRRDLKPVPCETLEGWEGAEGGRELQERGDICTTMADARCLMTNQHSIVKQLSSHKNK